MRAASVISGRTIRKAALLSLVALAASAGATTRGAFAQGTSGGIALQAVGGKHLEFTARPGAQLSGRIRVRNTAARTVDVRLTAVDVGTAALGGATYGDRRGSRTGSWVTLQATKVSLPGRSGRAIPFRVKVPSGTRPGVYFAGITAVDDAQLRPGRRARRDGQRIVFRRVLRFAMPVRITIPGPVSPRLEAREAKVHVDAAGANVLLTLENTGRTLIRKTSVDLELKAGDRTLVAERQDLREFVPETKADYSLAWPGIPRQGEYRLVGEIRPEGAPPVHVDRILRIRGREVEQAERSIVARTTPPGQGPSPLIWGALGGITLAAVGLFIAFARMRRRLKDATAAKE